MKVIHIIPSAFHYFDDIRSRAFGLMESLNSLGVTCEAITLETGGPTRSEQAEVRGVAPSAKYQDTVEVGEATSALGAFDLVHVHAPCLGGMNDVLNSLGKDPVPMVLSWHRPVPYSDLFSLFVMCYNRLYLPKLGRAASVITAPPVAFPRYLQSFLDKTVILDEETTFLGEDLIAAFPGALLADVPLDALKTLRIYQTLLQ